MPKELPGFYFDAEKNRYFPSSSKKEGKSHHPPDARSPAARPHTSEPAAPSPSPSPSSSTQLPQTRRRSTTDTWHSLQHLRLANSQRQRIATIQCVSKMMTAQLEASAAYQAIPIPIFAAGQTLTAFAAGTYDGRPWSIAGDSYGLLYTFDPSSLGDFLSMPGHVLQHSWTRRYHLNSQSTDIVYSLFGSSMGVSVQLCWSAGVKDSPERSATSFGSTVLVHNVSTSRSTVKVSLPADIGSDVWTSHLRDRSLVLGVRKRALLMQDVESLTAARSLETESDVFALHQEESLVFTGCRNGTIRRFDTRSRGRGQILLGETFTKPSNSITYLNIIKNWQLLVSTIRGAIEIFDVRFLQEAQPLQALVGHVNSYQPNLPHAITPSQDYFFAAGLDNRIRAWSLLTGELLTYPHPTLEITSNDMHAGDLYASPFGVKFEEQITSLEVIKAEHELCLFATSGPVLHRFILGRRFP